MFQSELVGGWAYPSETYEFVSWDDGIPNWMESHKSHVTRENRPWCTIRHFSMEWNGCFLMIHRWSRAWYQNHTRHSMDHGCLFPLSLFGGQKTHPQLRNKGGLLIQKLKFEGIIFHGRCSCFMMILASWWYMVIINAHVANPTITRP